MCQFLFRSPQGSAANFFTKNANHDQSDEAITMSKQQDSLRSVQGSSRIDFCLKSCHQHTEEVLAVLEQFRSKLRCM
jgi:hypothetical protein